MSDYSAGDELYIFGFSRGAYAARALTGLIGASAIQRQKDPSVFEAAWQHYRVPPAVRQQPAKAGASDRKALAQYNTLADQQSFHDSRTVACVGVWDTVGSYGIPAGFGFAALARYITVTTLGFHDTSFGNLVKVGLHAVAVDEHRRPFVPTFWTIPKGQQPNRHVEQTWFACSHCNVGGGYPDRGLSDEALIWMVSRVQALTGPEFDTGAVKASARPNIGGTVIDSTQAWPIDHWAPHYRTVLSPAAIDHGYLTNTENPAEEHINERVHWTVLAKRANGAQYAPPNLPSEIVANQIAEITPEERVLLRM